MIKNSDHTESQIIISIGDRLREISNSLGQCCLRFTIAGCNGSIQGADGSGKIALSQLISSLNGCQQIGLQLRQDHRWAVGELERCVRSQKTGAWIGSTKLGLQIAQRNRLLLIENNRP